MSKSVKDYSKCVIYKIYCKDSSVTYEYYGHTINPNRRRHEHSSTCTNKNHRNHNMKLYQVMRENGGRGNWTFEIIEEYPCQNINEATLRERYWIELNQAQLNMAIPTRTRREYYEDNREQIIERCRKYRDENREQILENRKQFYKENREKLLENKKKYYQENKTKINDKAKKKIICECGLQLLYNSMSDHRKSLRHINRLNEMNNLIQANENDGA